MRTFNRLFIFLLLFTTVFAGAQQKQDTTKSRVQTTGKSGSPSATTTITGDVLPAPDGKFEGIDKLTFTLKPESLSGEPEKPVTEEDGKHLLNIADSVSVEN